MLAAAAMPAVMIVAIFFGSDISFSHLLHRLP